MSNSDQAGAERTGAQRSGTSRSGSPESGAPRFGSSPSGSARSDANSRGASAVLIGPIAQLVTMDGLPARGPVRDGQLDIRKHAGVLIAREDGERSGRARILEIGDFGDLRRRHPAAVIDELPPGSSVFPGLVDMHTHMLWAGSRSQDLAARLGGKSYLEIGREGGGIRRTVKAVRGATPAELAAILAEHAAQHLRRGVTTAEVKSGYGLDVESELKMLEAVAAVNRRPTGTNPRHASVKFPETAVGVDAARLSGNTAAGLSAETAGYAAAAALPDLIATCLAAHINPGDEGMSNMEYLNLMADSLLPEVRRRDLAGRVDVFVEDGAFSIDEARGYLHRAVDMSFDLTVHADQFSTGGARLAVELGALSADHLEHSDEASIEALANSGTTAVALPGASLGLGEDFTPARELLDRGAALAIASDWNPGSAPNGDLLMQASVLASFTRISMAEVWAGITVRASSALGLNDRGVLAPGKNADIMYFESDWRDIIWSQGRIRPSGVWKDGRRVF